MKFNFLIYVVHTKKRKKSKDIDEKPHMNMKYPQSNSSAITDKTQSRN